MFTARYIERRCRFNEYYIFNFRKYFVPGTGGYIYCVSYFRQKRREKRRAQTRKRIKEKIQRRLKGREVRMVIEVSGVWIFIAVLAVIRIREVMKRLHK